MARKTKGGQRVVWPGFSYKPPPRKVAKIGRNEACPCGSGEKYKDCHEAEGSAFLQKLAQQEQRERWRKSRPKGESTPWYKRWLTRRDESTRSEERKKSD